MGTCGFLALGAFLLDIGELGGQLAVLAVLLVPLQRDRNIERDHVRVGRAALAVHQLDAHIGLLVGLRDVGFGLRDFFLLLHHGDFRVMGQLGLQVLRAQANRIQCRSRTQGIAGGRTYPAGQLRAGRGDLALGLFDAVVDLGDGRSGGEHIGLRAAPAPVGGISGVDLQARFVALGHQHVAHALLVETVQPGQGGVALQVGKRQAAPGLGDPGLALVASGAGLELVLARELLHHADGAHGHEVARRAESIGAVDGQVVDAELEGGVGPLAGGDRHVPCGRCRRILGDKRTRTGLRQAQRLVQRQGVGGMGGTGAHGERRSDADGEPAPWHGAARRAGGKRVDEHEISS